MMKNTNFIIGCLLLILSIACNRQKDIHAGHRQEAVEYTCPMHPEIISNVPGTCPICGMDLVLKEDDNQKIQDVDLEALLKPTNEYVVSNVPVTTIEQRQEKIEIQALGSIAYDTKAVGSISARISGRIEKLYVRYRYQKINKGQHILDIYSPEIVTAQQNLLFILQNDSNNISLLQAAKVKLRLLGMDELQLQKVIQSGKPTLTIALYSPYTGHIHEAGTPGNMTKPYGAMKDVSLITEELDLKEGMYVQKGQSIFTIYNPDYAWVILNVYGENQGLVKTGNSVEVIPETTPDKAFKAKIDFIEPFYRKDSKTYTTRSYFNNTLLKIPIGSQVRATITGNAKDAYWLSREAVLSLGLDKIVFVKTNGGFKAHKVITGITHENHIQILSGLSDQDSVALNAQYLMDSESFIKVKN
jgi:Cu(I)/Ag(I) efflux system membrane fusion protein